MGLDLVGSPDQGAAERLGGGAGHWATSPTATCWTSLAKHACGQVFPLLERRPLHCSRAGSGGGIKVLLAQSPRATEHVSSLTSQYPVGITPSLQVGL